MLALALTACQHRVRYRSTPPPTSMPSEAAGPAEKPAPATPPAPATGPATPQAEDGDTKAKRAKWAQEEAARLIRESVPVAKEVADTMEQPLTRDRQELQKLRTKAKTAHDNLTTARELYLRVETDSENQVQLSDRIKKLNDLITVMKGALKRIDSSL